MKTIVESIFNDDDIVKDADESMIKEVEKWINEFFFVTSMQIIRKNNKIMVKCASVDLSSIKSDKLISVNNNGMFEWGNIIYNFSICDAINLKSLEGCPKKVGSFFDCSGCISITSLEGAPEEVKHWMSCVGCKSLKSLNGFPKKAGPVYCYNCDNLKLSQSDINKYQKRCEKLIIKNL